MAEISLQEYCEQIENMIAQGRYTEAVAHGKHILKQYPKYVAAYGLLGKAMLEARQNEYAADMFRRVLSADPEDLVAWVVMSEVHGQNDELDMALWHLERAFELATDNKVVEEELRQLYGRRDGVEPRRVQLTRGALARLYLKGDLLPRAISELRALLAEHPERVDLAIALAEALWRNEQRLEASEVCQSVLDRLSYCLKANLILGEIWTSSGREEGEMYLRRAEALDPENRMAQELFGDASPLPAREVQVALLEYRPATGEERPGWMAGVEAVSAGPPLTEREATLIDIAAGLEAQIEIPAWLEEIDVGESPAHDLAGLGEELSFEEAVSAPTEEPALAEIPDWLREVAPPEFAPSTDEEVAGPEGAEEFAGEGIIEQVTGFEPIGEKAEEVPEWLAGLGAGAIGEEALTAPTEELPGWLSEVGAEAVGGEVIPSVPSKERSPDWLDDLRGQFVEEVPTPEPISPEEKAAPFEMLEEAPEPGAGEVAMPAWLEEGERLPTGDEALAWLQQLAAGKEEELLAQVEAEAEARTAEIMGRPRPVEPPVAEEPAPAVAEPVPAEIPDWLQKLAPSEIAPGVAEEAVVPEIAPLEEEFPQVEIGLPEAEAPAPAPEGVAMPAWLEEGEGLPTGDEALAWLQQLAAGKEEELLAQVEAEAEARTAEIMGRPKPVEPPVEEAAPEEAIALPVEEVAAPMAEAAFGWTTFGEPEAPPEIGVAEETPPMVEGVLPVEELAVPKVPEWVRMEREEVEAPPAVESPVAEEAPVPEAALPAEEVRWEEALGILLEEETAPALVVEEPAGAPEVGVTETVAEAIEEAFVSPAIPAAVLSADPFATERAYLKENPRDYEARLALARALWQAGEREEALEAYSRVIRAGKFLESIVLELEEYLEQWPDVGTQRALGDAYMKGGRLQDALDLYRRALENL